MDAISSKCRHVAGEAANWKYPATIGPSSGTLTARNHVILRKILGHLDTLDLIYNCSLVNKFWAQEARAVLRNSRTCTLRLNRIKPHEDRLALDRLSKSDVVHFTRVSIILHLELKHLLPAGIVRKHEEPVIQLMERIRLKALHIVGGTICTGNGRDCELCVTGPKELIKWLLFTKASTLAEISFDARLLQGFSLEDLTSLRQLRLTALRTLRFSGEQPRDELRFRDHIIKPLVSKAPNLSSFVMSVSGNNIERIPARARKVLKKIRSDGFASATKESTNWQLLRSSAARIEFLQFYRGDFGNWCLDRFFSHYCTSIRVLQVDLAGFLAICKTCHSPRVEAFSSTLQHLCIISFSNRSLSRLRWVEAAFFLRGHDFLFPNLNSIAFETVIVAAGQDHCELSLPSVQDLTRQTFQPRPRRFGRLKELILRNCCFDITSAVYFATVFPGLVKLSLRSRIPIDYTLVWRCWPLLESLRSLELRFDEDWFDLSMSGIQGGPGLTMKTLRQKSPREIRELNLHPQGIVRMAELKELEVNVVDSKAFWNRSKFAVPKIFEALLLPRVPQLKAQFKYVETWERIGEEHEFIR